MFIWHFYDDILLIQSCIRQSGPGVLQKAVEDSGVEGVVFSPTGMLRMNPDVMVQLFCPTVDRIKGHVSQVLLQPRVSDINYLFLVGGFAESQILQAAVREAFSESLTVSMHLLQSLD